MALEAGVGVLDSSRLQEFLSPQAMMDELIDFYTENYPELAKAVRGWCTKNGIPFTH